MTGADATPADFYEVGTLVMIKRMMRDEETMQLIVQGTERIRVLEWTQEQPYLRARVEILPDLAVEDPEEVEAIKRNMQAMIQQALAMLPQVPPEVRIAVTARKTLFVSHTSRLRLIWVSSRNKDARSKHGRELLRLAHGMLAREVGSWRFAPRCD